MIRPLSLLYWLGPVSNAVEVREHVGLSHPDPLQPKVSLDEKWWLVRSDHLSVVVYVGKEKNVCETNVQESSFCFTF
jgi:hypothetical protein